MIARQLSNSTAAIQRTSAIRCCAYARRIMTRIQYHREQVALLETELQLEIRRMIQMMLSEDKQSLREWARSMNISAGYACDIAHGRRKISKAVLAKVLLGANG